VIIPPTAPLTVFRCYDRQPAGFPNLTTKYHSERSKMGKLPPTIPCELHFWPWQQLCNSFNSILRSHVFNTSQGLKAHKGKQESPELPVGYLKICFAVKMGTMVGISALSSLFRTFIRTEMHVIKESNEMCAHSTEPLDGDISYAKATSF
jgi:hypothetical protein